MLLFLSLFLPAVGASAQVVFEPAVSLRALGSIQFNVHVVDVDLDGRLDVLTSGNAFSFFRGQMDGTFADPVPGLPEPQPEQYWFAPAEDFDEEGQLDLVGCSTNGFAFLPGNGDGTFTLGPTLPGSAWQNVLSADLDLDGHLDLAAIGDQQIDVMFHFGDGAGGFPQSMRAQITRSPQIAGSVLADLDGNGFLDLAIAQPLARLVLVVFNQGGRTFLPAIGIPFLLPVDGITAGDLDGNGHLDLVVSHKAAGEFSVVLGDGARNFEVRPGAVVGGEVPWVEIGDYDLDGKADVACANSTDARVHIFAGDGTGGFSTSRRFMVRGLQVQRMLTTDFNVDGRPDIVAIGPSRKVVLLKNATPTNCRAGNVNARAGQIVDVLFLNDAAGSDPDRRVTYPVLEPVELRMKRPPAVPQGETAPYAVYAWPGEPPLDSRVDLPFGIGCTVLPVPLTGGDPQPSVIWNNAARFQHLGVPDLPSSPAPGVFLSRAQLLRPATFTIQGLIYDPASGGSLPASITNAITGIPVFQ